MWQKWSDIYYARKPIFERTANTLAINNKTITVHRQTRASQRSVNTILLHSCESIFCAQFGVCETFLTHSVSIPYYVHFTAQFVISGIILIFAAYHHTLSFYQLVVIVVVAVTAIVNRALTRCIPKRITRRMWESKSREKPKRKRNEVIDKLEENNNDNTTSTQRVIDERVCITPKTVNEIECKRK